MPPHWLHAGPRSRPARRAGTTGGVSVNASAAARVVAGWLPATVGMPGVPAAASGVSASEPPASVEGAASELASDESEPAALGADALAAPLPPFAADGPAVSDDSTDVAASSAILRART